MSEYFFFSRLQWARGSLAKEKSTWVDHWHIANSLHPRPMVEHPLDRKPLVAPLPINSTEQVGLAEALSSIHHSMRLARNAVAWPPAASHEAGQLKQVQLRVKLTSLEGVSLQA